MQNEGMVIYSSLNTKPTVARMINVISVFVSAMSQNGRLLESFFLQFFFRLQHRIVTNLQRKIIE